MADPSLYTYPSPLAGYENADPLGNEISPDGKSFVNPQTGVKSKSYERFCEPLDNGRRGALLRRDGTRLTGKCHSDIHIYHYPKNAEQAKYAKELWERIRREFPELRIYRFWEVPVGPHPIPMFEVNLFTPEQFGAFIPWLAINRGPLSALVHPNTVDEKGESLDEERDHTQRAIWMGEKIPLDLAIFKILKRKKEEAAAAAAAAAAK
ncbi:DOPA 45-dioxygenase protein [Rutstroemia sp. NJR-2017a BVV2]|nr:DOPA 45-dioxygenase protein [Rutstroemia sp. NJR-2017a BVV2]